METDSTEGSAPRPAAGPPPVMGQALGHYVLEGPLGEGGMATVFRALDTRLQRPVALKFLHAETEHLPRVRERFAREAQAAARLNHPNLVKIHGAEETGGRLFLVMEFIDGTPLDRARPPRRTAVAIVRRIAEAIDHAHRQGVVHRDLKPANVILDTAGEPHVVDFGLAHLQDAETRLTRTGSQMGTPAYMSPEQVLGRAAEVDERTDVYGLGAILYEMVTGRPPFVADTLPAIYEKIVLEDPEKPTRLRPDLPPDLETVCLKSLAKEPARRYASAAELAADLGRWLDGEPILARPFSVTYWLHRTLVRHRPAAAAAAIVAMVLLAVAAYLLGGRMTRERQRLAWTAEGDVARNAGDWPAALGAYERALALDTQDGEIAGRRDAAARRVREERARLEAQRAAAELYASFQRELYAMRLRSYRSDWRLTEADFARYEQIADRCRRRMEEAGESADGWWIIGRARHARGDWRGALDAYAAGLKVRADHPLCLLYRARALVDRVTMDPTESDRDAAGGANELLREAIALIERGQASEVDPIELDIARGYQLGVQKQPTAEYCDEMLNKWAGADFREEFFLVRGIYSIKRMADDAALAIAARPGFVEAWWWRGTSRLWRGKDVKGAIEDFTRAVELHPRFVLGHRMRGTAHTMGGDSAAARRDYERAVELDPDDAVARTNVGEVCRRAGDLEAAVAHLTRAIELRPRLGLAHGSRGLALEAQGAEGARADLERAMELGALGALKGQVEAALERLKR